MTEDGFPSVEELMTQAQERREVMDAEKERIRVFQEKIFPILEKFRNTMEQLGFRAPIGKGKLKNDEGDLFVFTYDTNGYGQSTYLVVTTDGLRKYDDGGYVGALIEEDSHAEEILLESLSGLLKKTPFYMVRG